MSLLVADRMKRMLSVIIMLVGCGTSVRTTLVASPLHDSPRPLAPRTVESVEVFLAGPPPRPHVGLALLEGEQTSSYSFDDTPEILEAIRERAAALGCDGIVFKGLTNRMPGLGDAETLINDKPKERKGVYAVCIVYRELSPDELAQIGGYERAQVERTKRRNYESCLDQQRMVGKRADETRDPAERSRILRTVPVCMI
ncbi:MAG TPA: hypothetical protein VIU61_23305 [Kofleriaceae bacterium]